MKRFWLFCGADCYPSGGMGDFHMSFDNYGAAIQMADKLSTVHDWVDVYDSKLNKIVWPKENAGGIIDVG
ncbi:hypothetical protein LCGC14_0392510 [marine sediment metagenome]|uniref:Uncharacterized protein n=1 Tax=marine sediment metagenome TaxID=412755 RepID=A0A0F9THE5_9ZZZZ